MKKMIVVLFLFFLLVSNLGNDRKDFTLKNYASGEYTVYTNKEVNEDSIFLGTCYMTKCMNVPKNIIGESIKTSDTELVSLLNKLEAEIVKTENLDCGAVVISAYSPKIDEKIEIDGKNVNLQIASYTDYSIIGWPMIMGSF